MKASADQYYSLSDIVANVKAFSQYLLKKWWVFVLAVLISIVCGYFYYVKQKPRYDAVCTFIVEEKQNSVGNLGSIASQFGFDIGSIGGGASIFAGDNILDILQSKKIVQEVLLTPASQNRSLADLYLDFAGFRKKWKYKPELASIKFPVNNFSLSGLRDSVLNIIYESVLKKNLTTSRLNKKGTIIKVQVASRDNFFSRFMAERLVNAASKLYLNIKTATSQTNIDRMQRRSDSLLALLNNKSYTAANAQPLDINPGLRTATVPTEIALRDKTVIATLYTEVTKNLEVSRLLLSQQTPVIQVLDKPGQLLYNNKKSMALVLVVGGFFGGLLTLLFFIANYFFKNIMHR